MLESVRTTVTFGAAYLALPGLLSLFNSPYFPPFPPLSVLLPPANPSLFKELQILLNTHFYTFGFLLSVGSFAEGSDFLHGRSLSSNIFVFFVASNSVL